MHRSLSSALSTKRPVLAVGSAGFVGALCPERQRVTRREAAPVDSGWAEEVGLGSVGWRRF